MDFLILYSGYPQYVPLEASPEFPALTAINPDRAENFSVLADFSVQKDSAYWAAVAALADAVRPDLQGSVLPAGVVAGFYCSDLVGYFACYQAL